MAFILDNDSNVISFADTQDVFDRDQRVVDANESLTDAVILSGLTRATERILTKLKGSDWWKSVNNTSSVASLPDVNANLIIARQQDFTDLCVYSALSDYILPGIADFSNEETADRQKMSFYDLRARELYVEIITLGDWYDANNDGSISIDEVETVPYVLKRVR